VPGRFRPSPSINSQENTVNRDQAQGRVKEVKGKAQAGFGDLKEDIKKPGSRV